VISLDDWRKEQVLITGGTGFVGRHLVRELIESRDVGPEQITVLSSKDGDLRSYSECMRLIRENHIVFHLAGEVGAIAYSAAHNASQLYTNAIIGLNIIEACFRKRARKVVLASSICAYPDSAQMPLKEEYLFQGEPTWTNYGYGTAKRLLVSLSKLYNEDYNLDVSVLLGSNVYGPGDDFGVRTSHTIPSLIRKFVEDKEVIVWGDGTQSRDFLFVRDFTRALVLAAEKVGNPEPINVGSGKESRVSDIVKILSSLLDYRGTIRYDTNELTGQAHRSVDITRARKILGYEPQYTLERGIKSTLDWYLVNRKQAPS
jgi:GDP-L-fucose synthase